MTQNTERAWRIGDFLISNKPMGKMDTGFEFKFDGSRELSSFLTKLDTSFGPMGEKWDATLGKRTDTKIPLTIWVICRYPKFPSPSLAIFVASQYLMRAWSGRG